ncbi:hypothetical protein ACJJTC_002233 [Scirpophaga incertulas]
MCRTGMCRFDFGNWIFLVLLIHLFTYVKGEELAPDPGVRFAVEPADVVVLEGEGALLPCAASSARPVRLAWRYSAAGMPTRDQTLTASDQHRRVMSNGSLVIEGMSAALAGQYQCVATVDGVGTIVSRPATVFLAAMYLHYLHYLSVVSDQVTGVNSAHYFRKQLGGRDRAARDHGRSDRVPAAIRHRTTVCHRARRYVMMMMSSQTYPSTATHCQLRHCLVSSCMSASVTCKSKLGLESPIARGAE